MKKITRFMLVKRLLLFFIVSLFISGLTAIPVDWQLSLLLKNFAADNKIYWLNKVLLSYRKVNEEAPFLLYGYDWLAFAHFVLAILFIGPYKNPLRNIWVIEFGMIASALVLPFAFVAEYFRGIPVGWRLIDCSFGIIGFTVLWICHKQLRYIFFNSKNNTSLS